jgi:hypothetical protein
MTHASQARQNAGGGSVSKRFYSERELAIYSGISARTLQGWRLRSQGPPWRKFCGSSVRYDLKAFDAWTASQPGGGEISEEHR